MIDDGMRIQYAIDNRMFLIIVRMSMILFFM
jgi:hypothetical protein